MTPVPTISITDPDLESKDYMPSRASTPVVPDSPSIFDVVKELENEELDMNLNDDEPLNISEEKELTLEELPSNSIRTLYKHKSILLTGVTGFVGKAIFWKLLNSLGGSVEKIYVLLRPVNRQQRSARGRLQEDVLSNKAFVQLRRTMGHHAFDTLIEDKVVPLFGDLSQPNMDLSDEDHALLLQNIDLIIHCAANMDGNESLKAAVKTNCLGTLQLLDLANKCKSVSGFIYLSSLQYFNQDAKTSNEKHLYPLPTDDSAIKIFTDIMHSADDYPYAPTYSNCYLFSKSLTEHLLVNEVVQKRLNKTRQYPIAIMRLTSVGPSVQEPLIGWADGVNSINGTILLMGKGAKVIQPHFGDSVADVLPVDYVARLVLGCAATLSQSNYENAEVPNVYKASPSNRESVVEDVKKEEYPSSIRSHRRTASQSSRMSVRSSTFIYQHMLKNISSNVSKENDAASTFPIIYQVSNSKVRPVTWRVGYESIRQYWIKNTNITIPSAKSYFNSPRVNPANPSTNSPGLARARTVMNSIKEYYSNQADNTPISVPPSVQSNEKTSMAAKRSSVRLSRTVDKAAKLAATVKNNMYSSPLNMEDVMEDVNHNSNFYSLVRSIKTVDFDMEFDPSVVVPDDADGHFWVNYLSNAAYGIHYYVCQESACRLPTPIYGWSCGIQIADYGSINDDNNGYHVISRQVNSAISSQSEVVQRTARMVAHVKALLIHNTPVGVTNTKEKDDVWLMDLDDVLDDWCQDLDVINSDKDKRMALGKWRRKVGSNDESVKVIVLNDKRVNLAINQITQNAGVPRQTAVNEAMKILMRMSERTQLAFVWFTGSFLRSLLDNLFDNVRVLEDSLRSIRQTTMGKRVVYVPVSKSLLDPLIVWYIAIRYQLPVPALACDESMSQMGPISDVYRLAGAYYLKRDKTKRSPLNSAVTAAYTQVLLREHGALAFYLERSRTRTGKFQESYTDGLIDMVVEATLQTNQTGRISVTAPNAISRVASETHHPSPPGSPETPRSGVTSPTMSIDSLANNFSTLQQQFQQRKIHKDVIFVPINISYENVPELPHLIDEVLDQQPSNGPKQANVPSSAPSQRTLSRPSETMDRRNKANDDSPRKCGRVFFGVGPPISVLEVAEEFNRESNGSNLSETYEEEIIQALTKKIHESQCKALIVPPTSLVASIILYGRATQGVCIGKIKEFMEWLKLEVLDSGHLIDWQEGEDLDSIIMSSFRLLDDQKNIIIDGKEINDDTNIKVNDHADNVMALSYYSNQIIDVFLLDAFFAVVYLSFFESTILEDEFMDRFRFLVQLLEKEFVLQWDVEEKFSTVIEAYIQKNFIRRRDRQLLLLINMENEPFSYEQLIFLASLIYPTVDAYWITSCSLSALEAVPMLPRCIVPLLAQWIATHLITGRRTIYREVLSTESSRTAVDVFMSMGFLTEIQAKEKLSPDAQILLHELGIPTSEILIELSGQNSGGGKTPVSPVDPEGMIKAVMAQIEMNRANSNMADLCQQIDTYRLGAASQRESFQNVQVFQKCLRQIKGILQANVSFAKKRNVQLPEAEDGLAQLVYSLLASSIPAGDRAAHARALRRISEAYNLR
ncbi:male sterility protein-domain-containing protein [Pilobolus umbonatus]|nr:male sterility protein-domain-containing protein [Pilobolus umbonatus]